MNRCLTGEKTIDAHHAHLSDLIDKSAATLTSGPISPEKARQVVDEIARYADTHFAYEEEVIDRLCPPPTSKANKIGHAWFRSEIDRLQNLSGKRAAIETYIASLMLMRQWLTNHVCTVDCELRKHLGRDDK